ncbi:MAG: cob(I)yrinic acid a,c-diamide adenosyltransferase [Phycisphaerae bacterium]|nr:cob(I)yrinic acid a,c-diamide adenosyltransferase [Phycisphaerae bacterium]
MLTKGLVQIYTGDGKGKTTAAIGLAVRAAGQDLRVLFCQFLKPENLDLGERNILETIPNITLRIIDHPWDMRSSLKDPIIVEQTRNIIHKAFATIAAEIKRYDLIILDEIVFCFSQRLADIEDLRRLFMQRGPNTEIVLTGRGATEELIAMADLVTEMKAAKHPFDSGTPARRGIEY